MHHLSLLRKRTLVVLCAAALLAALGYWADHARGLLHQLFPGHSSEQNKPQVGPVDAGFAPYLFSYANLTLPQGSVLVV